MSKWAFVDHVTVQMSKRRRGSPKAPTLWPSEATAVHMTESGKEKIMGKCRRQRFFRFVSACTSFYDDKYEHWKDLAKQLEEEKKPVDSYMRWIWSAGELFEEHLINQAKNGGFYIADQTPVYLKKHNVSGKIDIESFNPVTGKCSIIEAKSVYGHGASAVLGTPAERNAGHWGSPKEPHMMQLGLYHWDVAADSEEYEDSRLVYGARDTGHHAEFLLRTTKIPVEKKEADGEAETEFLDYIEYKPHAPNEGPWIRTDITIQSILKEYGDTQLAVEGTVVPPRSYSLRYDEGQLKEMYEAGQLGKVDAAKYERAMKILDWNSFVASLEGMDDSELLTAGYAQLDNMTAAIKRNYEEMLELHGKEDEKLVKKYERAKARNVKAIRALKPKKRAAPIAKGDWQCKFCAHSITCYDQNSMPKEL